MPVLHYQGLARPHQNPVDVKDEVAYLESSSLPELLVAAER